MDIKQNIVRVKTGSQLGTGIIYPCETGNNEFDKSKFIIFTNRHVVEVLNEEEISGEDIDIKLLVEFDIYDKDGNLIDNKEIEKISMFLADDISVDIAAVMLVFGRKINIDLEQKLIWDDSQIDDIYIEGFPRVLLDNEISSKLQLKGEYKSIFPSDDSIGIFKISDDYHWYSNYKDLKLFQGFSGSPIYSYENDATYIVGMNRSMLNICDGENPFKLLYYYKIKYVLEYLRKCGCIIFKRKKNGSVDIRWKHKISNNSSKNINLLLLGSSGAGKSSFAKTFMLNSKYIDSTNDGQTTRSNIIYELKLNHEEAGVEIKFLTKEKFAKRMKQINYTNYLLKIISIIKGVYYKSLEDYLIDFLIDKENSGKEYIEIIGSNEIDSLKKIVKSTNIVTVKEKDEYLETIFCNSEKLIIKEIEKKYGSIVSFMQSPDSKKKLEETLMRVDGFFDVKEFDFLTNNKGLAQDACFELENDVSDYFEKYYAEFYKSIIELLKGNNIVADNNYSLKMRFDDKRISSGILTLCLQVMDLRTASKNNEIKSLTGIVDYVHIKDSISNEYSFILDDLDISKLRLFDTYGLDHVNWDEGKEKDLNNILYDLQEKRLLQFNSDLAVIYVKKLDSGKPTELKTIIPKIFSMIPQAPVYCLFNGLDIFFGQNFDELQNNNDIMHLNNMPKSIKYLTGTEGKEDILSSIEGNSEFGENLYNTLKNNITMFCSNDKVVQNEYSIYNNNIQGIYMLLLSICMKEYSSMSIIPQSIIDSLMNGKEEKYDGQIDNIIYRIFESASRTNWEERHYKTRKANYVRLSQREELGFDGVNNDRWNHLFHRGYVDTIKSTKHDFLGIGEKKGYIFAVDACIRDMEEKFLGPSYELAYKDNESQNNEFKRLIKLMYKNGDYLSDPFSGSNSDRVPYYYLNDVDNFKKGYESIKLELRKHFKKVLAETIEEENRSKAKNLMKINDKFNRKLNKLKFDFKKRYPDVSFFELLKYYSEIGEEE